jgi:hypothetical protein
MKDARKKKFNIVCVAAFDRMARSANVVSAGMKVRFMSGFRVRRGGHRGMGHCRSQRRSVCFTALSRLIHLRPRKRRKAAATLRE